MSDLETMLKMNLLPFALSSLLPAVILLAIGMLAVRLLLVLVQRVLDKSHMEKAAHSLLKSVLKAVLYILLALMVAKCLGIDVTGVIALASVLTLAVSLAVQNALTNVIGGLSLLYTKPFVSGDYIDAAGESGTVEEIGMTYTRLLTFDNKRISIPNSAVVAGNIVNYTSAGIRRVDVELNISYCEPSQKVIDALVQAGTVEKVLLDPAPMALITDFQNEGVRYALRIWTKAEDYWDVLKVVNLNIRTIFAAQDIQIAYPHVHVFMENK